MDHRFTTALPQEARLTPARPADPVAAGPLKSVAMNALNLANRAMNLLEQAREIESQLIGSRPEKDANDRIGREPPHRETFAALVDGALEDTLHTLNAVDVSLARIRGAL